MKTEVQIFNLRGNFSAIREYANAIASMSAAVSNAYVIAFDKEDEILWTVQAGDDLNEAKAVMNWQGVRRIEIYDHSADGTYRMENIYITSQKSLDAYTSERSASDFEVTSNRTACTADAWQTVEEDEPVQQDNSDAQDDGNNEDDQTPAEPSRLAQIAAKVAEKAKTYATRAAFILSLAAVCVLAVAAFFAVASAFAAGFDAVGIGGHVRFALLLCAFVPAADMALWIECNACAFVARIFPGMFTGSRPDFLAPGSFFLNVYRNNM